MEKAGAYFGIVPRLSPEVSDLAGVLTAGETRRIRQGIVAFGRRFPQSGFSVALMSLEKETPGAAYTYWVFNRCNPGGEMNQGSANRHLFLLVDTVGRGAWLTHGYGLEPFVSTQQLQRCLEKGQADFARGRYAAGIAAVIAEAECVLREVVVGLPRTFGLERIEIGQSGQMEEPVAAW